MTGKSRLPGGEPRKASQRQRRLAAPRRVVIERSWRAGDQVRWRDRDGVYLRAVDRGAGLSRGQDRAENNLSAISCCLPPSLAPYVYVREPTVDRLL